MLGHNIESGFLVVNDQNSRIGQKLGIDIFLFGPEHCIDVNAVIQQAESQVRQRTFRCFICTGDKTSFKRWISYAVNVGINAILLDDNIVVNRITENIPIGTPARVPVDAEVQIVLARDVIDSHFDKYLRCHAVNCSEQVSDVPDFGLSVCHDDVTCALNGRDVTLFRLEFI